MFDFIIRKPIIQNAQKFIDQLQPKVNVYIPADIPLPSVGVLKKISAVVAQINALEEKMSKLLDSELRAKAGEFKSYYVKAVSQEKEALNQIQEAYRKSSSQEEREQIILKLEEARKQWRQARQKTLNYILPETFALVREAGKRILGMRHFDVQLVGGIVLHEGSISEMTTGEGKTLVATLPAYLNAMTGEGVHIVTVNDYLAKRDCEWMGPLYEFLGLTVGVIQHDMDHAARQAAYSCDITYGTNNEFGFDYLRDNMVNDFSDMVQRGHHFAIVDEVDSILIDEARTPLIISGPAEESTDKYYKAEQIARQLKGRRVTEKDEIEAKYQGIDLSKGFDYLADEKVKSISLTEAGEEKAAGLFGVVNLHDMEMIEYRHHILQSLRAKEFFKLDVDYVVRDGQVIIVDEFTGRLMPGRRWSDGLHQAVEAKEAIKIERENQTLATITFQNYFRMYEKLAGMTGTAFTEANEFRQIYNLDVIVIPTNQRLQRINHADRVYKTIREKFSAVVQEIAECYQKGQPVLVGTISIEKSEVLSRLLKQKGIPHQVLNAKYHELEAQIIAQAGRYKAVTIATNMAGRGTDIVLGGNASYLAKSLADEKIKEGENADTRSELVKKFIEKFRQQVREEHEKVVVSGGLHIIGTERHESRRIDNQLRGRSGRQGDPGSSRFYIALEDDLMRLFASDRIMALMDRMQMEEGQALEHPLLTKTIEIAQKRVENYNFEIRKHLLEYDDVMNRQREVIYNLRRSVLESDNVKSLVWESVEQGVRQAIGQYFSLEGGSMLDTEGLGLYLKSKFNFDLESFKDSWKSLPQEDLSGSLLKELLVSYELREKEIDPLHLRRMERMLFLHTIDSKWKDHLYGMDQLKEGVGLRSLGQRDPLIEFKREGFQLFEEMVHSINREVAEIVFKIQPMVSPLRFRGVFSSLPQKMIHDEASGLSRLKTASPRVQRDEQAASNESFHKAGPKVGRNDPCPCGSGKKYKKCCGH